MGWVAKQKALAFWDDPPPQKKPQVSGMKTSMTFELTSL